MMAAAAGCDVGLVLVMSGRQSSVVEAWLRNFSQTSAVLGISGDDQQTLTDHMTTLIRSDNALVLASVEDCDPSTLWPRDATEIGFAPYSAFTVTYQNVVATRQTDGSAYLITADLSFSVDLSRFVSMFRDGRFLERWLEFPPRAILSAPLQITAATAGHITRHYSVAPAPVLSFTASDLALRILHGGSVTELGLRSSSGVYSFVAQSAAQSMIEAALAVAAPAQHRPAPPAQYAVSTAASTGTLFHFSTNSGVVTTVQTRPAWSSVLPSLSGRGRGGPGLPGPRPGFLPRPHQGSAFSAPHSRAPSPRPHLVSSSPQPQGSQARPGTAGSGAAAPQLGAVLHHQAAPAVRPSPRPPAAERQAVQQQQQLLARAANTGNGRGSRPADGSDPRSRLSRPLSPLRQTRPAPAPPRPLSPRTVAAEFAGRRPLEESEMVQNLRYYGLTPDTQFQQVFDRTQEVLDQLRQATDAAAAAGNIADAQQYSQEAQEAQKFKWCVIRMVHNFLHGHPQYDPIDMVPYLSARNIQRLIVAAETKNNNEIKAGEAALAGVIEGGLIEAAPTPAPPSPPDIVPAPPAFQSALPAPVPVSAPPASVPAASPPAPALPQAASPSQVKQETSLTESTAVEPQGGAAGFSSLVVSPIVRADPAVAGFRSRLQDIRNRLQYADPGFDAAIEIDRLLNDYDGGDQGDPMQVDQTGGVQSTTRLESLIRHVDESSIASSTYDTCDETSMNISNFVGGNGQLGGGQPRPTVENQTSDLTNMLGNMSLSAPSLDPASLARRQEEARLLVEKRQAEIQADITAAQQQSQVVPPPGPPAPPVEQEPPAAASSPPVPAGGAPPPAPPPGPPVVPAQSELSPGHNHQPNNPFRQSRIESALFTDTYRETCDLSLDTNTSPDHSDNHSDDQLTEVETTVAPGPAQSPPPPSDPSVERAEGSVQMLTGDSFRFSAGSRAVLETRPGVQTRTQARLDSQQAGTVRVQTPDAASPITGLDTFREHDKP